MKFYFIFILTFLVISCRSENTKSDRTTSSTKNKNTSNNSLDKTIKRANLLFDYVDYNKDSLNLFIEFAANAYELDSSKIESRLLYAKALLRIDDSDPQRAFDNQMNAQRIYDNILKSDSSNVDALLGKARIVGIQDYDECWRLMEKARSLNPRNRDAYYLKGALHSVQIVLIPSRKDISSKQKKILVEKEEKAMIDAWEKGLLFDPNWAEGYKLLGSYYQQKSDSICIGYFKNRLSLEPNNTTYMFELAYALGECNHEKDAIDLYKNITTLDANKYEAFCQIGQILQKKYKELDQALFYYSKALDLDPNHIDAFINVGVIYEEKKNYTMALKNYAQALTIDIRNRDPNFMTEELFKENQEFARSRANSLKKKL